MTLEEYARQQAQQRTAAPAAPEPTPRAGTAPPAAAYSQLAAAQKIIAGYKLTHEIAAGCRLQILQSIEQRENPYKLLLAAAEAIGRLEGSGDAFYLQVQQKLIEVYGRDVSEDRQEGQETA